MQLKNKTVLITGASSGIGLALALSLLKKGNKVIASGRNEEKLRALQQQHPGLHILHCDVSREEDLRRCRDTVVSQYSDLSILVNNAAVINRYDFNGEDDRTADIENEIATNLLAPIKLTNLLMPVLSRQQEAAVVNVSSGVAYQPAPAVPVYSASKAALHSFSQSLRINLQNSSIKVFEVVPPVVDTKMVQQLKGKFKMVLSMSTDETVRHMINGIEEDIYEIRMGGSHLAYWGSRFIPTLLQEGLNLY